MQINGYIFMINILNQRALLATAVFSMATITLAAAKPAQAISFSVGGGPVDDSSLVDFEGLTPDILGAGEELIDFGDGNASVESGTAIIASLAGTLFPPAGFPVLSPGTIRFDFDRSQRFIGFNWFSPNALNRVEFLDDGGNVFDSFTATDIGLPLVSLFDPSSIVGDYVSFTADNSSDVWSSVRFVDPNAGFATFSFDNVSYANVPTPALLPGLIGMGVAAMRKRRSEKDSLA